MKTRNVGGTWWAFLMLVLLVLCVPMDCGWAESRPPALRKTLHAAQEIQGYPCAKGYAWFYSDGRLETCTVERETVFGEARVPERSRIYLRTDGSPDFVFLSRDTRLVGLTCRGGGHSYMTAFYPSGKLKVCWLSGDQEVQGVPCMGASFIADVFGGSVGVRFWENGKLNTCKLSKDFDGLRRGQHIVFSQAGLKKSQDTYR